MPERSELIKGNIEALEKVYRSHFTKVYNVASKYVPQHAVDDIVQEVFLKLWRNKKSVSTELPIEQQLFTITKNIVFNHLRKKVNEKKFLNQYKTTDDKPLGADNYIDEKIELVKSLVNRLPKKQKQVFKMYRFEGLTHQEIASSLNISKNTVSNHLKAAMDFIKKNINVFLF